MLTDNFKHWIAAPCGFAMTSPRHCERAFSSDLSVAGGRSVIIKTSEIQFIQTSGLPQPAASQRKIHVTASAARQSSKI
jgi:hypothetical protein